MKRIVICFDGTWNKPADEGLPASKQVETNVIRFFKSLKKRGEDGCKQIGWYDEGVGSRWFDKVLGGFTGAGLEANIVQGYQFLAETYEPGDEIFVLGFSRGAYTARSLVGMIRNVGIVKSGFAQGIRIGVAYGIYRTRDDGPDSKTAKAFRQAYSHEATVKFLGVWDTVGALGIPLKALEGLNLKFYEFHDTDLSSIVDNAFHAVAVDEHRRVFDVCLWSNKSKRKILNVEQRWFVGSHSDCGGGYPDRNLSDVSLGWMQAKAAKLGLSLKAVSVDLDNCLGEMHDSYADFLRGAYAKAYRRFFREFDAKSYLNLTIDDTVWRRANSDIGYKPKNKGLRSQEP